MEAHQGNTCLIELQFLPPVQYLSKFLVYDRVVIEAHEHYQKRSYRNRCALLGPNGVHNISIPLQKGKNAQLPIREVTISYTQAWHKATWQSIKTAYGSAAYFPYYNEGVQEILLSGETNLWELNWRLLSFLTEAMDLPQPGQSDAYQREPEFADLRGLISPTHEVEDQSFEPQPYLQVFDDRMPFIPNLSALDLLLCAGPASRSVLENSITR